MSDAMDHLSDEQATLLWRRAAELQAEAARRLEERSRQLAPSERDGGAGFQLTEVKAAALEAGISPEFVELALAEVEARGSQRTPSESIERRARKFLGVPRTSIEVSRVIDAPPAEVFESLQRVLPSSRFALLHVNTLGDDPLKDGVFVFEPPSMWTQAGTAADFASKMGGVGVKRLYVSLREITAERSELSIRVPIAKGLRTNYLLGLGSVGIVGGGAGLIGAFMAAGAVGGIGIAAAPVVAGRDVGWWDPWRRVAGGAHHLGDRGGVPALRPKGRGCAEHAAAGDRRRHSLEGGVRGSGSRGCVSAFGSPSGARVLGARDRHGRVAVSGWTQLLPEWLVSWWALFWGVVIVIVTAGAGLHAVLSRREVRSSIGWLGLILFVPVGGAVFYALFGVNRIQRKAVLLRGDRVRRYPVLPEAYVSRPDHREVLSNPALARVAHIVDAVTRRPLLAGNRFVPLRNGEEAYPEMIQAIERAESCVTLCTYIFDNDIAGHQFVDALQAAVRRGVHVRVLVDAAGTWYSFPRIHGVLKDRGIPNARFIPFALARAQYMNLRNHRKILVVDGEVGYTGGMNIRYGHYAESNTKSPIQDLHFRVEGPVVGQLQEVFAEDWEFTTGESLRGPPWFPVLAPAGPALARGIPDGPDEDQDALNWTLLGAIGAAERSIRVVTPYFLPDPPLATALNMAAMRGVHVDLVFPAKGNLPIVDWAMWDQFWTVVENGCRIWLTPPPFDHSKVMVVDDHWTLFGSSNWDPRSLRLNFEFNVEVYCDELGPHMAGFVDERIAVARRITRHEIRARSFPRRVRDAIAGLFSPYL